MPLDTGAVTRGFHGATGTLFPETDRLYGRGPAPAPALEAAESLGAGLRAVREHYQLSLEDVALATCIRRAYLAGIETMRLDQLPSRPFVIGYVRAYATTLGLDPDRAVARFKMEFPDEREPLRAPIGVAREGDRRLRPMLIAGVLVIGAFLAWNIAQHAMSKAAPAATSAGTEVAASSAKVHAPAAQGTISVGAPLPAPQESTLPAPYVTPGLAETGTVAQAGPTLPVGAPFAAHGTVYGAEAGQSLVTLQAVKSASLIVRGADGTVYFARQLAAGEAYRAPQTPGLSVEVSDSAVVDVFVGGVFKSLLPAPKTAVSRLTDPSGG